LSQEDGWTIQLVAGRLERTALNMLERGQGDGGALRYTLGERQGEPWFMVLYGRYPSREAAQAAARQLSSRFGVSDPWVRSLASFNAH
jgi:DamX protein